ncbi:MAG: phosphodiester glycosidase family protein [Bacteroidales bacterium]|nr:phosphodiester glycosidase family protein [Bacteroidales bacterium]
MMFRRLSVLLLLFCLGIWPVAAQELSADEEAFLSADWHWQDVEHRLQWGSASVELFGARRQISVVRFNPCRVRTAVVNDAGPEADKTSALALRHHARAAVNGSYFDRQVCPVTLVVENGVQEGWTMPGETERVNGVVAIRGRRIDILVCDTLQYPALQAKYRDLLAAGPVLLCKGEQVWTRGELAGSFYRGHPRTVVGKDAAGQVYFLVIDGRHAGHAKGVTLEETIRIARFFGLVDAINLDGGGSSTLWVKEAGVLNYPCDNGAFDHAGQRVIPNILSVSW